MKTVQSDLRVTDTAAARRWLAGLLLGGSADLSSRFVRACRAMAALSRPRRRRLQHRLSLTLTSAALLLALAGPRALPGNPALAEGDAAAVVISVVDGEVANVTNGKCGLMEAIINARANRPGQLRPDCTAGNLTGPDTVSLPDGGEFVLTGYHNSQFGPTGLPVITSDVIIEGNGATIRRSTADGTPDFRILAIDDVGRLTLQNVIIRDGKTAYGYSGGGVLNKNVLTLEDSRVAYNTGWSSGGGIYAEPGSTTTISGSDIHENMVMVEYGTGGGLAIAGTASIVYSGIGTNLAQLGGGLSVIQGGSVTVIESGFGGNTAAAQYGGNGGGIWVGQGSNLSVIDSTIAENFAAGGLDYGGYGGGVFVGYTGKVTISGSTISGNRVTSGGQYGASAPWDGPGYGGGIFVHGEANISNSTISGNEANRGGGIYNGGTLTLTHATVSGNHAMQQVDTYEGYEDVQPGFGGGMVVGRYGCATTTLIGTIIAGNTADDGVPEALVRAVQGCSHVLTVDAFNVFGHDGASGLVGMTPGPSDIVPNVPLASILSPLSVNGGATDTHALPLGSPAIDVSPNATCAAAPINGIDQRGRPRNSNGAGPVTDHDCDAGSFEAPMPPTLVPFIISAGGSGTVGGLAFTPADLIKFDPAAGWSMVFDASDYGISKNLTAFEIMDNGDILMTFAARQAIGGLGTATPFDVVRFRPSTGAFSWYFRGKQNLLTTTGERIDALALANDGRLAISTTGTARVRYPAGGLLQVHDEDALGFDLATRAWSGFFNGTCIRGLRVEDVNALWVDKSTDDLYISILGMFNLSGVRGNGKDIVRMTPSRAPGGLSPSLWWDGSAAGFPSTIDGLEILR